ncbi:MAG: hypothetical protein IPK16_30715, partial [Anaerolineales bacterium]|nr:hypothetical protein [Anaerolineales bacterium]
AWLDDESPIEDIWQLAAAWQAVLLVTRRRRVSLREYDALADVAAHD